PRHIPEAHHWSAYSGSELLELQNDDVDRRASMVDGQKDASGDQRSTINGQPTASPTPSLMIGERTNVTGSKQFARLIREKNYDEAMTVARQQVDSGANMIDVNMDEGLLDSKVEMVHFLNMIADDPDVNKVPIMVDSSKFEV